MPAALHQQVVGTGLVARAAIVPAAHVRILAACLSAVQEVTSLKTVVVGDGAVGKTSMLMSYTSNAFPEEHVPTVFDNDVKDVIFEGTPIRLGLWDTAGQADYARLRPLSYPGTHVFLVCFSVISPDSFANITSSWLPEIRHSAEGVPFILVGTKSDLRDNPEVLSSLKAVGQEPVRRDAIDKLVADSGAVGFVECSALTQDGLDDVFTSAIRVALGSRKSTATKPPRRRCAIL